MTIRVHHAKSNIFMSVTWLAPKKLRILLHRTYPVYIEQNHMPYLMKEGGKVRDSVVKKVDEENPRIEASFRKYFYRSDSIASPFIKTKGEENNHTNALESNNTTDAIDLLPSTQAKHEFEIIVCHANVIRYLTCRALQIPPECWLRFCTFNCSITYFTIRFTGSVMCQMLGDIGHLQYDQSTFSMHNGFNW